MASANVKKPCGTCKKNAGVATCNGCQQSFCLKHFGEHRQELSHQIDNIGQEHDLLRRDFNQQNLEHVLFLQINTWKKESIAKIQVAAEAARGELQRLLDENKKELRKSVTKITDELQVCRESDDYTEIDIKKWTQQLQALREMLEAPSTICIDEDETPKSIIHLIRVRDQQQQRSPNFSVESVQHRICAVGEPNSSSNERFDEVVGEGNISEGNLVITNYSNSFLSNVVVYGGKRYSSGTHRIYFRIDKIGSLRTFFGITTSFKKVTKAYVHDESLHGWWDLVMPITSDGRQNDIDKKFVETGDEVTMTLDCDNQEIQLQHHRTNRLVQLFINIRNCPFPWKVVLKLTSVGDSVRLLQ